MVTVPQYGVTMAPGFCPHGARQGASRLGRHPGLYQYLVPTFYVSSTYPNWEGVSQTRLIEALTDDEFRNTNPDIGGGRGAATNSYRRAR